MDFFKNKTPEERFEEKVANKEYYDALEIAMRAELNWEYVTRIISSAHECLIKERDEKNAEKILEVFGNYETQAKELIKQRQMKTVVVEGWSVSGAEVIASFDISEVTAEFQGVLSKQLEKKGLVVSLGSPDAPFVVRGRFVRIDEGSRLLRYFFWGLLGKAFLEVEGELIVNGKPALSLIATENGFTGVFGGQSKDLLKSCANLCAKRISKQVLAEVK